jgi:predicted permease
VNFLDALVTRVAARPGVDAVSLTTGVPLGRGNDERFVIDGRPTMPGVQQPVALTQWVTEAYYRTFQIALVRGRYFSPTDREDASNVAIVDEEFAKRYAPGGDPAAIVGARVRIVSEGDRWRQIVGVVRHVRHAALDEQPRPELYAPYSQMEPGWQLEIGRAMDVAVRSSAAPETVVAAVRTELHALDPDLPLSHVQAMSDAVAMSVAPRAFSASVLGGFALVALLLSALGIYGVISYGVAQQAGEIGVRMALGATEQHVLALVLMRAVIAIGVGSASGLAASFATNRLMRSLLYSVTARDPLSYALGAMMLVMTAIAASWLPARRALRLDPITTLRQQ